MSEPRLNDSFNNITGGPNAEEDSTNVKAQNEGIDKAKEVKEKKRKKLKTKRIVMCSILAILVIVLFGMVFILYKLKSYYNITNYTPDEMVTIAETMYTEEAVEGEDKKPTLSAKEKKSLEDDIQNQLKGIKSVDSSNVYNLLLIGTDYRPDYGAWGGNSDTMILCSIDEERNIITLTSFMRDTSVVIPEYGVNKLNYAYARGGGPLLVQTIEENFKIDIDNYASVNFTSVISIIDLVGGVDITISEEERVVLNQYSAVLCSENFLDYNDFKIEEVGFVHLNGIQALAYMRIRSVGNFDYERTERQRRVMLEIFSNMKKLNIFELDSLAKKALPFVTHNMKENVVLKLLGNIPSLIKSQVVSSRLPYDGHFSYSGELIVPDYSYTIKTLHDSLYNNQ